MGRKKPTEAELAAQAQAAENARIQQASELAAQAEAMENARIQQAFEQGTNTLRDLISPSSIEIHGDYFRLGTKYGRTLYISGYPRSLYTGWISPIINIDEVIDVSMYIYPVESAVVMKNLRTKVTQLEASMNLNAEKGRDRDPAEDLPPLRRDDRRSAVGKGHQSGSALE